MSLVERRASTLADIFKEAKAIRDIWNPNRDLEEEIWFRGQAKRRYQLVPGLYRDEIRDFKYDEAAIFHAFTDLGHSYATFRPANDWEWYFVAQHHGLPTRLLDWTENLLAAVYFAIESFWQSSDKRDFASGPSVAGKPKFGQNSPTIWVMDAGSVNLYSQGVDCLYGTPKDELATYLPRFLNKRHRRGCFKAVKPLALHSPRQTQRIIAQQGMFTIHGRDATPLDIMASTKDRIGVLKIGCIILDQSRLVSVVDELLIAGVTKLSLFPELDSVAEHIKWHYRE